MPGFTAPKILWVERHEPEIRRRLRRVLLPKDYLRLRLTGEHASEMSDAAGTLWLDVAGRRWSAAMLAATGLDESAMPRLFEGSEPTGELRPALAAEWGMGPGAVVAGGAGDNAAGAVGVGVVRPGRAFLSLGTRGLLRRDRCVRGRPGARGALLLSLLPRTWHQMSVMLRAASPGSRERPAQPRVALLAEIESVDRVSERSSCPPPDARRTTTNAPALRAHPRHRPLSRSKGSRASLSPSSMVRTR
jgi:xylulokinase